MTSYRNDRLPNYYEGFPIIELTNHLKQDSINWTITRENCCARKNPIFQKMCILAEAVQALSGYSKESAEALTVDIISSERLKDKEYQKFGNLLAVLCFKTSSTGNGNDTKPIEEVFDFISGWST